MLTGLIYLDENLASSISLRYAGQHTEITDMLLQAIHVEEPDVKRHSAGSSWVRQSWEKGLLDAGRQEIERLLKTEKFNNKNMGAPKIVVGKREEVILTELKRGGYDLFVEGYLNTANSDDFYQLVDSNLYRNLECPALIVKNLVPLNKITILAAEGVDCAKLLPAFSHIYQGTPLEVSILYYKFRETDELVFQDKSETGSYLDEAEEQLKTLGWAPLKSQVVQGKPEMVADYLRDVGLVVSSFPTRKSPRFELLAQLPNPLLLCK